MPLWLHDKFRKRQKDPLPSISAARPDPPAPADVYGHDPIVPPRGYELGEFAPLEFPMESSRATEPLDWIDIDRSSRTYIRHSDIGLWRYRLVNKYPDACCAECGADKAELEAQIVALDARLKALEVAQSKGRD